MNKLFNRIVGTLLIATAILGLFFSLIGIAGIWSVKNSAITGMVSGLDLITASLETTGQGLAMVQQSFTSMTDSITSVQGTLNTAANTVETTKPMFDSLNALLSNDLPNTVTAVQTSLDSAYESAKIIDTVLRALTILNRDSYNPSIPLHEALAQISDNLDSLPQTLATMETSIENTADQAEVIQADLRTVAASIASIEKTMTEYESILGEFESSLKAVKKQINILKDRLPRVVNALVWVLTIFLLWMAIAQLGLLTQGWELLHRNGPVSKAPPPVVENAALESANENEAQ